MALDKFDVCSRALVRVGGHPINSFEGEGAEEVTAATLYESAVRALLSAYRWRFSSMQVQLTRLLAEPMARWSATYECPANLLNIHAVMVNDTPIKFDRFESYVFCDAQATDTVIMDMTYRSDEAYWAPYFEQVLELRLAADFAVPIAEDADKAQYYEQRFLRQYAMARNMDAQGRTARKMPVGGFAAYVKGRP